MTLFEFDALVPVRTGRHADAATSLAWLIGLIAVGLGAVTERLVGPGIPSPLVGAAVGLAVAGVLLGLVASSVRRAIASGFAFGVTVVVAGGVAAVGGVLTPAFAAGDSAVALLASAIVAVVVPVVVGATIRFAT